MSDIKYRVRNWKQYNQNLVQRGSLTFWISEDTLIKWKDCSRTGKAGRPEKYPHEVISCGLHLKAIFRLNFRSTEGFLISIMRLLQLDYDVPDYTTLARRQKTVHVELPREAWQGKGLHLVIDSTGLKVFGEGEWKVRGHGTVKKRLWRKLHLAINSDTQMIEACDLTELKQQDCQSLPTLLAEIKDPIERVIGDGAYDRFSCFETVIQKGGLGLFPPQRNAATSEERPANKGKASPEAVARRDESIKEIRALGRKEWKKSTGYHKRSLAETGMFRLKTLIGGRLASRKMENQMIEARIWCSALNKMTRLGMPQTVAV